MSVETTNTHTFKVGDILVSSWGYDQTNIDFYEVLKVTKSTVSIRELQCDITVTGFMCGNSVPLLGEYSSGEVIVKRPKDGRVRLSSYAVARLWNGQPQRCSWYA